MSYAVLDSPDERQNYQVCMARNWETSDLALPWTVEVRGCEMPCCHINRFLPSAGPVASRTETWGEKEAAG